MAKTEPGRARRRASALSRVLGFGMTSSSKSTKQGEKNLLERRTRVESNAASMVAYFDFSSATFVFDRHNNVANALSDKHGDWTSRRAMVKIHFSTV